MGVNQGNLVRIEPKKGYRCSNFCQAGPFSHGGGGDLASLPGLPLLVRFGALHCVASVAHHGARLWLWSLEGSQ